eukprot:GHRR01000901.1.p1 GENE.GHRR01000901.1~~GHRR01000901.1.p1  ORF type:complete len:490 (+),score=163.56 GHRR01000901.1:462-1931(+)
MALALQLQSSRAFGGQSDGCLTPCVLRRRHLRIPVAANAASREALLGGQPKSSSGSPVVSTPWYKAAITHPPNRPDWSEEEECVQVDESFEASDGAQLSKELIIGKHIGSGSAADVYKLKVVSSSRTDGSGEPAELVLKMAKPVPGLRQAFKREWMLGRRLNAVAEHEPELNLLIHTGPAITTHDAKGNIYFRGAVLEAVRGKSLDKRLEADTTFCDVDFLLAMLQQVLTTLHKAHTLVGFEHGDMRISNIMEHVQDPDKYQKLLDNPSSWQEQGYESACSAALAKGLLTFRILDFGHSSINERRSQAYLKLSARHAGSGKYQCGGLAFKRLPAAKGLLEAFYSFWYKGKSDAWRLLRSLATRLDGRAWPQRRERDVLRLYRLMEDVLDLKLEAKFFQDTVPAGNGQMRRLSSTDQVYDETTNDFVPVKEVAVLDVTAKPRRFKLFRGFREKLLRFWSRFFSRKPRVSAKEVLRKMQELDLLGSSNKSC